MSGEMPIQVDPDSEMCFRCGSRFLDTGWECTECGYDNMYIYSDLGPKVGEP